MSLLRVGIAVATLGMCLSLAGPAAAQQAPCQFVLGFKTLHDLDPGDVGDCVDDQVYVANGDAQQHTQRGLMVWRKADNWTAFTDGYRTWINGPDGLQARLNTARFPWETATNAAPAGSSAPANAAPQPLVLTGTSFENTSFSVPASGAVVVKMDYQGNDNFVVKITNSVGGVTTLANQIGTWSGATALGLAAGTYQLGITSFGSWTITIWTTPHWPVGGSIALPLSGTGANILPFTVPAGSTTFTVHYYGNGVSVVRLLRDDGSLVGYLGNQVNGAWVGQVNEQLAAGNYLLAVDASGPWTVNVSQP
jgi:hypothetical protein